MTQPTNVTITIEAIKGRDGRIYVDCGGQMMPVNNNHIKLIDHRHYEVDLVALRRFQEDYDNQFTSEIDYPGA